MAELDPMVDALLEEGAQALEALPSHAARIATLLATHFPAQTLEAVHNGMRPTVDAAAGGINPKVAELSSLAREEAAVAAAQFRALDMWLRLKQPAVSDGNNFGVDVQNYVLGELQAMRTAVEGMVTTGRDYYWSRGQGLEKVLGTEASKTAQDEISEVATEDGEKKEKSVKKTMQMSSTTKPPAYPDYKEYVICVDVRQYHNVYNQLTDMRNNYLKAHVLFAKNMKKLSDPRGDGDGKSANVMSMF